MGMTTTKGIATVDSLARLAPVCHVVYDENVLTIAGRSNDKPLFKNGQAHGNICSTIHWRAAATITEEV